MTERLRACCSLCGSLNIRKSKRLRIYSCMVCKHSFVTPSMRMDNSYSGHPLKLGAALTETEK